jgi:hypothetical protein
MPVALLDCVRSLLWDVDPGAVSWEARCASSRVTDLS